MSSLALSKQNSLSQAAYNRYADLDLGGKAIATYIYVDNFIGQGERTRSKGRVVKVEQTKSVATLPIWSVPTLKDPNNCRDVNYEDQLVPVKIYKDPFLGNPNILVLCHIFRGRKNPSVNNNRVACEATMEKAKCFMPWFGFEQEYHFKETDGQLLGWPKSAYPEPIGPAYCGIGPGRAAGRQIVDSHLKACLYAGLNIYGTNSEIVPGQWEFQTGPTEGIDAADELWVARYILCRVAEDFGVDVTFKPTPIPNTREWIPSGCHVNFSTQAMRDAKTGIKEMEEGCKRLELKHAEHLCKYGPQNGKENRARLEEGYEKFTWGYEDRSVSVRIPEPSHVNKCGYIEDRRPASNCDPYLVIEMLMKTVCLNE